MMMEKMVMKRSGVLVLLVCWGILFFGCGQVFASEECGPDNPLGCRPVPEEMGLAMTKAQSMPMSAAGYCSSSGGNTSYERITSVSVVQNQDKLTITVNVYIANPTGCSAGSSCPEYDNSPEYVNVWIDYDGDGTWESQERVMNKAGTGYLNISYQGNMKFLKTVTIPAGAVSDTMLRANLGWGFDPDNPCQPSWAWGNVYDKAVQLDSKTPEIEDILISPTNPTTKKDVTFTAKLKNMTGYEVVNIAWSGDINSGSGNPSYTVQPDPGTHGKDKHVTATLKYRKIGGGGAGTYSLPQPKKFNLFFEKTGEEKKGTPNWFKYWTQLNVGDRHGMTDVRYDAGMTGADGQYGWSTTYVRVGPSACGQDSKPPGTKIIGIDNFAQTLTHECLHYHHWNTWFKGINPTDTDFDELPNWYEDVGVDGKPNTSDANELDGIFNGAEIYDVTKERTPGNPWADDEEWVTHKETDNNRGPHDQDWANPGKQTTPPEATSLTSLALSQGLAPSVSEEKSDKWIPPLSPPAEFSGSFSDQGVDNDSDGLFNYLTIEVGVDVTIPGEYLVTGGLKSNNGSTIWLNKTINLIAGERVASLSFQGPSIYQFHEDGPYKLIFLNLYDNESNMVDTLEEAFITANYEYTSFQMHQNGGFIDIYSDFGIDTNGNGLFDTLDINVDVNIEIAGNYMIEAYLQAQDGTPISYDSVETNLPVGQHTLTLSFDGMAIRQSRVDGPYFLRSLTLVKGEEQTDYIYEAYETSVHNYSDFEVGEAEFTSTSTFSDYGVDLDSDGLFDVLRIEASANILQTGPYAVVGHLFDSEGNFIDGVTLDMDLTAGLQTINLDFSGVAIRQHGQSGPYVLRYAFLYEGGGSLTDSLPDAYTTQNYQLWQFDMLLAGLTGYFEDYGVDTNANGLFDELRIGVEVDAIQPGNVIVEARLESQDGTELGTASNFTSIVSGPGLVTLKFNGSNIYASGKNGPYILTDVRAYHTGDPSQSEIVEAAYDTEAYLAEDFEPVAVIRGFVKHNDGTPIGGAVVSAGSKSVHSNDQGEYFIGLTQVGSITINVDPPAGIDDGPWKFLVNGNPESGDQSITVGIQIGVITNVEITLWTNEPPEANAGPDQPTVERTSAAGGEVTLDGSGSSDPDGDPLIYDWTWDSGSAIGVGPAVTLPMGLTTVTLIVSDGELSDSDTVDITVIDSTAPEVVVVVPIADTAVQDGITLSAEVTDLSEITYVSFTVRERDGVDGTPVGFEDLSATYNDTTGNWEYAFDSTQLPDGYYQIFAVAVDEYGNEGISEVVNFSIRNWAVVELLPSSETYRAGRTMPIKFSLRISEAVDPAMPFVYNEELKLDVYQTSKPANILQSALFGDTSKDYRINAAEELYITNFKTAKKAAGYTVEIWRIVNDFFVDSFTFETARR